MPFRRRRGTHARSDAPPDEPVELDAPAVPEDRPDGPYDITEVDDARGLLDLGGSGTENGDWQHGRPTAASVVSLSAWLAGFGG